MYDIAKIDENFKVESKIEREGLVFCNVLDAPFSVHGLFYEDGKFRRLPRAVAETVNEGVLLLHANTAGGRVRFRTNSPYVAIHAEMGAIGKMSHFPLTGSAGFDLYCKIDGKDVYQQTFMPPFTMEEGFESIIELGDSVWRDITIHFPLYSEVTSLYVGLADGKAEAPKEYKNKNRIVYYGSSITQGGCASRPGLAYENILSRRFDCDHVNLGFSGNARGEKEMAEYIKNLDMTVFVLDYDHNARSVEDLQNTHEAMYKTVRSAYPHIPILMLTRPKLHLVGDEPARLEVVKTTYENAKKNGDENVYFLSGPEMMAGTDNEGTVDNCHPNDIGFCAMAKAIGDVLKPLL